MNPDGASFRRIYRSFVLTAAVAVVLCSGACAVPNHVYLTWRGDPSTSIVVSYHTAEAMASKVYFDTEPRGGEMGAYARQAEGEARQIPGLADGRYIHHVELRDLQPGQTYYFRTAAGDQEFHFRTIPADDTPIRFAIGGDMSATPAAGKLAAAAAARNPMFLVVGGDLAYDNGELKNIFITDRWLTVLRENLVAPDGALIPLHFAIGNHEVNKSPGTQEERAPYWFHFFEQGGSTYFLRRYGANLAVITLDSGHIQSHVAQVPFLKDALEQTQKMPWTIAVYHVPFFPTHRAFDGGLSVEGRKHWQPLFEEYGLDLAFENHDHTFKRSKPILGDAVNEKGIVYLGDGCMGVPPRPVMHSEAWYVEKASSTLHFWFVEATAGRIACEAVNLEGAVFDTYSREH